MWMYLSEGACWPNYVLPAQEGALQALAPRWPWLSA